MIMTSHTLKGTGAYHQIQLILSGGALVSMMVSSRFQRLGDLAAGTLVVYRAPLSKRAANDSTLRPTPPPIPLSLDEQRAILDFAERVPSLNEERAEELAAIPAPVLGPSVEPVRELRFIDT